MAARLLIGGQSEEAGCVLRVGRSWILSKLKSIFHELEQKLEYVFLSVANQSSRGASYTLDAIVRPH